MAVPNGYSAVGVGLPDGRSPVFAAAALQPQLLMGAALGSPGVLGQLDNTSMDMEGAPPGSPTAYAVPQQWAAPPMHGVQGAGPAGLLGTPAGTPEGGSSAPRVQSSASAAVLARKAAKLSLINSHMKQDAAEAMGFETSLHRTLVRACVVGDHKPGG